MTKPEGIIVAEWKAAESIDAVRAELRDAIHWSAFHALAMKIEGRTEMASIGQQKAIGFAEFGVRSGLITPAEGNEWLDGIWEREGKEPIGKTWMKYKKTSEPK